ncbi:hypothetical protein HPB48_023070 [Haemaphysalis longicornis]|uniref:Uncharacterized protein n=1 Tax=Haemaphysalis longicornis TaxID=44386 RepID=A0A9J6H5Z3_HAELO|nr:hypothetical protein HPB48_023070 [Haemaphysalis longicornis]
MSVSFTSTRKTSHLKRRIRTTRLGEQSLAPWRLLGAVPSIFPDCPKCLTSQCSAKEAAEAKRLRLESSALQKVLQQSAEQFQHAVEEDRIQSINDLGDCARCDSSAFWHATEANERIVLLHTVDEDAPSIKYSVTIKADFSIVFHYI